jgi:hypothetical protein
MMPMFRPLWLPRRGHRPEGEPSGGRSARSAGNGTHEAGVGLTRSSVAVSGVRPPGRARAAVLLKIYAHCIGGQADAANKRITDALGTTEPEPGPGDEGDDDSQQAS